MSSIDEQIASRAAPQGGYIHRDQLGHLALTAEAVRHRIRRGFLIPAYYCVYAVGHEPTDPVSRAKGALLAAGPRSGLTHDSAASYYGAFKRWSFPLHVVVPTDRRITGLVIHRNRRLLARDIVTPEPGLRVTSPAITILDLAPQLPDRRLRRVVNELRLAHNIPLAELQRTIERFPRHPGAQALRPIVATSQVEPNRSSWEDEWPAFAAKHALPSYVMNQHVAGHRVDVLFTAQQVIVELDGWSTHQTHEAFIKDRNQDADILARSGIPTVRITYERFHQHPAEEADRLHAILNRRASQSGVTERQPAAPRSGSRRTAAC